MASVAGLSSRQICNSPKTMLLLIVCESVGDWGWIRDMISGREGGDLWQDEVFDEDQDC